MLDQRTTFRGLAIDLLEFIRANRKYFVIKPNDEYGGKGVTLGFAASQSAWDDAIEIGAREDLWCRKLSIFTKNLYL